ncbi:LuxR C-terminal-related transcriptional regulator [Mechercharimyces sp. CAU 1602]|uniref:LuxR C-terminal-related transcriptional regulator n=1 Tax=Mechercharimyces sp. CAU 1602 TaxID=2973933 RepID=UPI0021613DB2|nr:LuxR C-terminal-related transcriptional regulator [Mechercharimyces sp. CAU 1602]MCS1352041.1 LuxR C-terminal-related transcriptional regulator [Mechercharimyces sp. CAU 1602]
MNGNHITVPSGLFLLQSLVQFEQTLLHHRSLHDLLNQTLHHICTLTPFTRGCLFWHSPLSHLPGQIYTYRVEEGEVSNTVKPFYPIQEFCPMLSTGRPLYLNNVSPYIPSKWVEQFHLSSVYVVPLRGQHQKLAGVFILDIDGRPFQPTSELSHLLETLHLQILLAIRPYLMPNSTTSPSPLSTREQQVLQQIAKGYNTKKIAQSLLISDHTVNEYASSILYKLEAKNRAEAVAVGLRKGWIE